MLLARGALCRFAADVPKTSPHDLPQLARVLRRTLLARHATTSPAARALSRAYTSALHARRSYATTARATKPTATVKKAVKAAVAKKPAAKKPAPKKRAAPATKAAPAKKPARKPAAKKPAAKKAAVKPKPRRVKKVLTPEEREKVKIRELRVKALKEPVSQIPVSAYNAYVAEKASGKNGGEPQGRIADAARAFKSLTPAEHEHYNHIANEKTAAKIAEYKAWILSHTADEIRLANNARVQLRKKLAGSFKKRPAHTARLHDDRAVKKVSPYNVFLKDRHASGDFKGIKSTEAIGLIANEWKSLSAGEKKKYQDNNQVNTKPVAA